MTARMTMRERVVITLVVCLTIIIAGPLTVLAATGQLVNIVDPSNAARQARVSAVGALQVEARLGIPSGALNFQGTRDGSGWLALGSVLAPNAIAITELTGWTASSEGGVTLVSLQQSVVDDGASCTTPPTSPSVVRRMMIKVNSQQQLTFPSPIYLAAAPAGKRRCIFAYASGSPNADHYVAWSGYKYTP